MNHAAAFEAHLVGADTPTRHLFRLMIRDRFTPDELPWLDDDVQVCGHVMHSC